MKRNRSAKSKSASSLSERAGLVFPVEDVQQSCADALSGQIVEEDAAVFLIGVLEYLVLEILTRASQTALLRGSPNITLHDLPGLQDKKTYAVLLERCKEREVRTE